MTVLNIRLTGIVSILAGVSVFSGNLFHVILNYPDAHWLMLIGDILLIFAITGLYAVQARQSGAAGLLGYTLTVLGLLVISAADFIVLADTHAVKSAHDVWMYLYADANLLLPGTFALLLGLLISGLCAAYARVLPRWSGVLLALAAPVMLPSMLLTGMSALFALSLALLMTALTWMGTFLLLRSTSPALVDIANRALPDL